VIGPALAAVVDAREPAWVKALAWEGRPAVPDYLPAGDLWLSCSDGALVGVERKTPSDLLGSLRDQRLFHQLAGLRAVTPWTYLVVTGWFGATAEGAALCWGGEAGQTPQSTSWRYDAVQGALLTAQETGAHVVHCAGDGAYQPTCLRLARRHRGAHRLAPVRLDAPLDAGEAFLAGLPGIGPERARLLLEHCGSPAVALHCLTDGKALPTGVGRVASAQTRRLLGLEDGFILALNVDESATPAGAVA
jgi:ERCC4-type nuclease